MKKEEMVVSQVVLDKIRVEERKHPFNEFGGWLIVDKKGLIHRARELSNGRWTYRLYSNREPLTIDTIISCPCLDCVENLRCESEGTVSPRTCEMMTNWILALAEGKT